jgi:hypothetical protein
MLQSFWNHHRYQPSVAETNSWTNSLKSLAIVAEEVNSRDIGVVLEYHLPYSGCRIDAIFFGKNTSNDNCSTIVELKQWSEVTIGDTSLNVIVNGAEHVHPSQQALDYAEHLCEIHSSYIENQIKTAPCSYCHNLSKTNSVPLEDNRFSEILKISPFFMKGDEERFVKYLDNSVSGGNGQNLLEKFINGRFKPNKKLLDIIDSVIHSNERWHLLDNQRLAYNAIWAQVLKIKLGGKKFSRSAILVRGGPGTGKTVIATQLLADAIRNGYSAVHTTGGKAFTTNLRAQFKGAHMLFAWNLNMRNVPTEEIDLLLVDEAHRIRYTSDMRWTPVSERNKHSQIEELLNAAKVTVFLLDENQYVRPDEIGCTDLIRNTTKKYGINLFEYDLNAQFRCGGCLDYVMWIENLLGFYQVKPSNWLNQYSFKIVDSTHELEKVLSDAKQFNETARIVAGFCWKWSDPLPDGSLISDVTIGNWSRPWNEKPLSSKAYKPETHPYTIWANTPIGESQIGCIYSAQGFEFDRMGVIWGPDLVWRKDRWVEQRQHSFDSPVKSKKADTLRLVRNAYRVLLTRGIKETRLLCLDEETRNHIINEITRVIET